LVLAWLTPLAFTACSPHSKWCTIAYSFTTSGGKYGFLILLLFTGWCYTLSESRLSGKLIIFLKTVISLTLFFGALAFLNEHYTKPLLKLQRPSHVYMLEQTGTLAQIDSLYARSKQDRQAFFAQLLQNKAPSFQQIDPKVQEHWIEEAGFSFPSGHSFNAFLFAIILAYAIIHNRSKPEWRRFYFIPFIWALGVAVSRVALGAHSALDVSAGAALGIMLGCLFLYIDITRHWLTRK
jgi:phosphatidylglycerophosphatase B